MVQIENIPATLRDRPQWVLWANVTRNGETTKVPYGINARPAKPNDPETWSTIDAAVEKFTNSKGYAGLGFVFSPEDDLVGIDLDGCRDPETGAIAQWAQEQVDALDTYAEVSPTQTGVKLFAVGKSPLASGRKRNLDVLAVCDKTPAVEMYDRGRFFAVTGDRLPGPTEPQDRQVQLDILAKLHFSQPNGLPPAKPAMRLTVQGEPSSKERARAYLAKVDAAVSGQSGHNTAWRAACKVCIDFNLDREDALELLREWNARCVPPWSEFELAHKVDDALQQPGERGRLLGTNGSAQGLDIKTSSAEPVVFERLTSAEFDAGEYEQRYLVEDVLVQGEPLVIAAQLKSMKTSLAVALAVSLALARRFLNTFLVPEPVNVLIMSGESGRKTLQSTGRRVAASYGHTLSDATRLFWSFSLPRLGNTEHLLAVEQLIRQDAIEVLIVDPLYFMLPGEDANNLMVVGGYLRTLSALCESLGVTLVVVHHNRRTGIDNRHEPPELSHISWSGTAEWARQWLLLGRRKDYVPGSGEHLLWAVTGGSAGHSGLHALNIHEGVGTDRGWSVDVLTADEVREQESDAKEGVKEQAAKDRREQNRRKVIQAAAKFPDGATQSQLRSRSAISGETFGTAVADALDLGELVEFERRERADGKGRTLTFYKLGE